MFAQKVRISEGSWTIRRVAKTWIKDYKLLIWGLRGTKGRKKGKGGRDLDEFWFCSGGEVGYYHVQEHWEMRLNLSTCLNKSAPYTRRVDEG